MSIGHPGRGADSLIYKLGVQERCPDKIQMWCYWHVNNIKAMYLIVVRRAVGVGRVEDSSEDWAHFALTFSRWRDKKQTEKERKGAVSKVWGKWALCGVLKPSEVVSLRGKWPTMLFLALVKGR